MSSRTPWENSTGHNRTGTAAWQRLRRQVLDRDRRICQLCGGPEADTVDHVVPVSQGGTDDLSNLRAVHDRNWPHCHRQLTSRQGVEARNTKGSPRRPPEAHPGLRT